jgi:hypothetical protein
MISTRSRFIVACGLLGAILLVAALAFGSSGETAGRLAFGTRAPAGSSARFTLLATQQSNNCSLKPNGVEGKSPTMRLQGACCTAMDEAHYRSQVRGLRAYATLPEVPSDPYDISVRLARRLLTLDQRIQLRGASQSTYTRAMAMSKEHGPCCCHCWRWEAFRGLAKYLIVEQGWRSAPVADVIELIDGCGGPGEKSA